MGHYDYGGRGTAAAAMVHRVIMISTRMFVVFCVCAVRKTTSTWLPLSVERIIFERYQQLSKREAELCSAQNTIIRCARQDRLLIVRY